MCPKNPSSANLSQLDSVHVSPSGDYVQFSLDDAYPTSVYASRGTILSGVLDGAASYEVTSVMTDLQPGDDSNIEYVPEHDCRVDKFDALAMGVSASEDPHPKDKEEEDDSPDSQK